MKDNNIVVIWIEFLKKNDSSSTFNIYMHVVKLLKLDRKQKAVSKSNVALQRSRGFKKSIFFGNF